MTHIRVLKKGIGKRTFGLMQAENLLLNCILSNQVIYSHFLFLANAVCPVGGLLFYGRIPPWVEMYDIVGCGKVEAESTSLAADEEEWHVAMLKLLDET